MATLRALPHLYSSVERGYRPELGQGFQTVAVAEELVGTEDLQALEDASFYAVPRNRDASAPCPIKESFFRLPSGRYAVGRAVYWGVDALGRDGNYLAHHLVVADDELRAAGGDPFALLDAAGLAAPGTDLTPCPLPPLTLDLAPAAAGPPVLDGVSLDLMANLATALLQSGETGAPPAGWSWGHRRAERGGDGETGAPPSGARWSWQSAISNQQSAIHTILLIGDEGRCRSVLRALFAALAIEVRLRLTFSTHFRDADHLRSRFALVAVRSREDAPARLESYTLFDLDAGRFPSAKPTTMYAEWLAGCLRNQEWDELRAVNVALDGLRAGRSDIATQLPPVGERSCDVLWEQAGEAVARALPGDARRVAAFLRCLSAPRPLADMLLAAASPSQLCGADAAADVDTCLEAMRAAASPRAWRRWLKRWTREPDLAAFARDRQPWWRRWKRRASEPE